MGDLKYFAERLINLETKEVEKLAEILKNEFGIEPAGQKVDIQENGKAPISRQERRKREREAKKKQKRG